jgi:hypothetical protein
MSHANETEAREWVAAEIKRLRAHSYAELVGEESQAEHRQMKTADGKPLILETQVFWDDREERNLRVIVDVWDPAKRLSLGSIAKDDFIRAPDESFVDEPD